jgi:diguanylate cyclase (GGDEF)-like protein
MTDDMLDPITGLYRTHEPPWLAEMPPDTVFLHINLRDFKVVNDQHGMHVGDRLLAEMARRLRTAADPWPAYRVGGDEFLVIARMVGDHAVRRFAGTIRAAMEQPYEVGAVWTSMAAVRAYPGATRRSLARLAEDGCWAARESRASEVVLVMVETSGDTDRGLTNGA